MSESNTSVSPFSFFFCFCVLALSSRSLLAVRRRGMAVSIVLTAASLSPSIYVLSAVSTLPLVRLKLSYSLQHYPGSHHGTPGRRR